MNEILMQKELASNCKANRQRLNELLKTYDLAVLGYEAEDQQEKDIYNRVLAEHAFYAEIDGSRLGVKVGDRITDDKCSFLMSDADFDRFQKLAHPLFVEEKITDENGNYITNWLMIKCQAMNELSDFIIDKILPDQLKQEFEQVRRNVTYEKKLIDLMRKVA